MFLKTSISILIVSEDLKGKKYVKLLLEFFSHDPIKYYSNETATFPLACIDKDDSGEHLFQLNLSLALFFFFQWQHGTDLSS